MFFLKCLLTFPYFSVYSPLFVDLKSAEIVYIPSSSIDTEKQPSITLKCRIVGNLLDSIQWLKNGKPLNSSNTLVMHHPMPNDNGIYKCIARNKFGSIESQPLHVKIHSNIHNLIHSMWMCDIKINNINAMERILQCRYTHNNRSHRKRSASDGGSQLLSSSKRKKISVAENNAATINCDVNRLERKTNQISVRWKKDGKLMRQLMLNDNANNDMSNMNPMENRMLDGRIIVDSKNGSMTITSVIPSDSGIYEVSCLLRNGSYQMIAP